MVFWVVARVLLGCCQVVSTGCFLCLLWIFSYHLIADKHFILFSKICMMIWLVAIYCLHLASFILKSASISDHTWTSEADAQNYQSVIWSKNQYLICCLTYSGPHQTLTRAWKQLPLVSICTHHRLDPINGLRNRYLSQNRPWDESPPCRYSALPQPSCCFLSPHTQRVSRQPFKTVRLCLSSYFINARGGKRWCNDWQRCGRLWWIGFMFGLSCASWQKLMSAGVIIAWYGTPVTFTEVKRQSCGRDRFSG